MQTPLLQVKHISKTYKLNKGWFKRESVEAVKGVSFELNRAHTVAVVGEAGSGKSTLAHLLAGELELTSGEILLHGQNLATTERQQRCMDIRLIPQKPSQSLNPRQRVGDQVIAPLTMYRTLSQELRQQKLISTLRDVGLLTEHAEYYPNMLSSSQRLRVALARALIVDPEVLVFDQTLSAMDVTMRAQLVNLLSSLQQSRGMAYIIIGHQLSMIRHLASEVLVMQHGEVIERTTVATLFSEPQTDYTQRLMHAYKELTQGSS
ncbi:ATP-binding cassette domain-containing protein [Echinimonas agarilytica]|uniref:ATP-binding cassette domain-containing protein n=1 Tax=Echinimonas agarilytica TaxID=1215918 RepID=A0AA41W6T1_9GAMM|nr:ATP-binding cassette domain-containing protein [Echinimonas agarilytica]MCM2680037.1 ATP-binding cassette domain-containing protein [Echinimonas agarilytica]